MTTSLDHRPAGPWQFDRSVADVFDDMLSRSIPDLQNMRRLVTDLAEQFVEPGSWVLDLGCSSGGSLEALATRRPDARFAGIDNSPAMLAEARARIPETVELHELDLSHTFPALAPASVVLSVLTLQFLPPARRPAILAATHDALEDGGALVIVEKVSASPLLQRLYRGHKLAAGYSAEAVDTKARALRGVMHPLTADQNVAMLRDAGFTVERFWTSLNFAGWIATKG